MVLFIDKRTSFYYLTGNRETALSDNIHYIPSEFKNNPNIRIEIFEPEEEKDVLTNMMNNGILDVSYNHVPYTIGIEDLTHLNPNFSEYYYSMIKLNRTSAKNQLWEEELYLLCNVNKELKFIKTTLNKEKYLISFVNKTKAEEFLANVNGYKDFIPIRFKLDKKYKYCILDETPLILES